MTNDTDTPPQMTQQTPQTSQRLERIKEGRMFAGLAAGLGRRFDLSPWLFRIGFIVLSFFGGLGILLYLIGWLLVPEEGHRHSVVVEVVSRSDRQDASTWIGMGLLVLAGLIVFGWLGVLDNNLFWAAILVVLGVLLYRGDLRVGTAPPPAPPDAVPLEENDSSGTTESVEDESSPGDDAGATVPPPPGAAVVATPPQPPPPSPRPRRPSSILGRLTAGAALVAVGGMAVADTANWIDPAMADYVAVLIGVLGIGLLVGAFFGRSVTLIVVGVLLLPVLFFARFVPLPLNGEFGEIRYEPTAIVEVDPEYSLSAGSLHVDLRDVELNGATVPVKVEIGAGEVVVELPAHAALDISASVGVGELVVLNSHDAGFGLTRDVTVAGDDGKIVLEVEAGFGSVHIRQARS